MLAASAQLLRAPAEDVAPERLEALLDVVGAPPAGSSWPGVAGEPPAPAPLFRQVPRGLQERRSDNWLAWNVGRVRPDPFAILFERYWRPISAFCLSIVGSREEADDAAAEAMSRAYATLSRRAERPEFRPWIHAIARNVALDRLRQRNRGPQLAATDEVLEVPQDETPGDVLGRRESLRRLVDDLQSLSERQRAAIVMRELSGMSHEEIAAALQTTPSRSQALVADARQALADRRSGREIRCGEYRREVDDRGRLPRGHRFSAHRAACADCRGYVRPRLLSGVFFLPAIEFFARAGRRIADAAGPALGGVGPAGAAKVAAGAAVVAMAVPAAQQGQAVEQRDTVRDGGGIAAAAEADRGTGGAAAGSPAGRARDERPGGGARSRRDDRERSADGRRQARAPEQAAQPPSADAGQGGEGGRPAAGRSPANELSDTLRQKAERVTEPVRRQAGELVDNVGGAIPAPPGQPAPQLRLPGGQGTEEIVRDVIPGSRTDQ